MEKESVVIFWFRRDLRLEDNVGLHYALSSGYRVLPLFVFDKEILEQFTKEEDRRITYIYEALEGIQKRLQELNSSLLCVHSTPMKVFDDVVNQYNVKAVYTNEDYEPVAIQRDEQVSLFLGEYKIPFYTFKDHVIFKAGEVMKGDGTAYQIYTPYSKKWRSKLTNNDLCDFTQPLTDELFMSCSFAMPTLESLGYKRMELGCLLPPKLDETIVSTYNVKRDFPAEGGTTHIGIALRFGTISIRKCVRFALRLNDVWLSELIWRDFFIQIMYLYPQVVKGCFKPQYESIQWRNNEEEFALWCQGKTGYPMVDAGMRELNQTGFMHNRVRMVVASFLTKHLLIDWRWGEAYFAQHLLDYDLSANNGNWQWAAGCGCDAAPYFRVFNPSEQQKKFDSKGDYIKKWIPELDTLDYPTPIVDHKEARLRAIAQYKQALK
ncbi:deoxyribodipyrimidine photo-lyase [Myroides pelagicus]|uniref:cryptochrome/photolyase family protein n=1 Tax=Myroides pelagicus TaxID=270914 RepID=UPI002DBB6C08|nr:deoxyribodipyrimidine photo-lyase [Myroides pelagicus]MEC4115166.1 deoxyribodipyrimidine photo-lyase [Myroides pelagicus]